MVQHRNGKTKGLCGSEKPGATGGPVRVPTTTEGVVWRSAAKIP